MKYIFDFLYLLAVVGISPVVIYRMITQNRYRKGWMQKFGRITRKEPGKKCIWIHAVSVGEVNATRTIINELKNKFPDFEIVVSTTTDTGYARAAALFVQELSVFYFPFDFSLVMRRAFKRIKPTVCLLMELEVWPNFVDIAANTNVPIVVVNGRISDKSCARYKLIKPVTKKIFEKIALVLAQTDEYANQFREIGCPAEKVIVTGSLKYDTAQICDKIEGATQLAQQLDIKDKKIWVAGATGNDEESILLDVYRSLQHQNQFNDVRFVIVPRKPERFKEVAQTIKQKGFGCLRYSELKRTDTAPVIDNQTVILGDTMGDLRKFYSLATVIFVGRTLVPMGGSDMMEAAALGKCTIFGPYAFNFKQAVNALIEGQGAIMAKDKQELLQILRKCLLEPDYAKKIAKKGRDIIKKNQGATKKTIKAISNLLLQ